jgi:hypothetical protein
MILDSHLLLLSLPHQIWVCENHKIMFGLMKWNKNGRNELMFISLNFKINNGMEYNRTFYPILPHFQFCSSPTWEVRGKNGCVWYFDIIIILLVYKHPTKMILCNYYYQHHIFPRPSVCFCRSTKSFSLVFQSLCSFALSCNCNASFMSTSSSILWPMFTAQHFVSLFSIFYQSNRLV